MEFGKNTSLIKKVISSGDAAEYTEKSQLGRIIIDDATMLVNVFDGTIQQVDKDAIVSDVVASIWSKLPHLYFKVAEEGWNERQVNGYLAVAVKNKVRDYWKTNNRVINRTVYIEKAEEDDSDRPVLELREKSNAAERLEQREKLFSAIRDICQEPRAQAESLLSILYTFIDMQGRKNSEPSKIAEELNGQSSIAIYTEIERGIKDLFEIEVIPFDALEPLRMKVEKDPEKRFNMTSRQITLAVYNVVQKMKSRKA